ncbi:MAG: EamA family transporter [Deltaproteobacteria bacterium]
MNITDKFVISSRVRKPMSYAVVEGAVNLSLGVLLALCLDWSVVTSWKMIMYPAIAGVIYGLQYYIYYHLLSKEDVSTVVGLIYLYPVIVALLSFVFLGEKFSLITYGGIALILVGGLMLSLKGRSFKGGSGLGLMTAIILMVAIYEFVIKLATSELPVLQGLAVSLICVGLTLELALFHGTTRRGVPTEFRNLPWVLLGNSLALGGMATLYFAMAGMPATIVATICATQPLLVLFLEKLFHFFGVKMCSDERLLPKLIPVTIMVCGIIMLYEIV